MIVLGVVPLVLAGLMPVIVMAPGLAALSYVAARTLGGEVFPPVAGTAVVPALPRQGALLPMEGAPWLDVASQATPFRHVVDALRSRSPWRCACSAGRTPNRAGGRGGPT